MHLDKNNTNGSTVRYDKNIQIYNSQFRNLQAFAEALATSIGDLQITVEQPYKEPRVSFTINDDFCKVYYTGNSKYCAYGVGKDAVLFMEKYQDEAIRYFVNKIPAKVTKENVDYIISLYPELRSVLTERFKQFYPKKKKMVTFQAKQLWQANKSDTKPNDRIFTFVMPHEANHVQCHYQIEVDDDE